MFNKKNLLIACLALFSLGSLFFHKTLTPPFLKEYIFRIAAPSMGMLWEASGSVRFGSVFGESFRGEIERLKKENEDLQARVYSLPLLQKENNDLKSALKIKDSYPLYTFFPVRPLGFFWEGSDEYIIISGGTNDGIHGDMLVLDGRHVLVGRVSESYETTSRVKLVTSSSETLNGVIPPAGIKVLIKGNGFREFTIDLVPGNVDIHEGDSVYASENPEYVGILPVIGKIVEVRDSENSVFKAVKALHLYDPQASSALVVVKKQGQ